MGTGDLVFSFDKDEMWIALDSPTGEERSRTAGDPRDNNGHVTRRGVRREPTPTPENSPRHDPDAQSRKRAASAYEYFGRERRVNSESGSVTWVRI